jgi:arylsulfatase
MGTGRRTFLKTAAAAGIPLLPISARASTRPPNIVVIACDDLGYGDLSCYGSAIATPNIDSIAQQGVQFLQCDSASSVCSPARGGIMTGRYPNRYGIPRVLDVTDTYGLPASETTIAQMLKASGYATMAVGKWHLGCIQPYLPINKGFDNWFGIPYSIDQGNRPLMSNTNVIEAPAELTTLTQRYTRQALSFINRSAGSPFFLYLAHSFPHLPLAASQPFLGHSFQGLYGDVVQEIDYSTGQVLQALQANNIDRNTLVIFTSDHGPWYQGSPGGLRGRKGETFEGGVRVPFLARFPGYFPAGVTSQAVASTLDILPTVANLTGAAPPPLPLDGVDLTSVLTGQATDVSREAFLYFNDVYLQAARLGDWKLHVTRFNTPAFQQPPACGKIDLPLPAPEMYDVVADPDESHDRADRNPGTVAQIRARMDALIQTFPPDIQNAWTTALSQQVQGTPSGSYPVPASSCYSAGSSNWANNSVKSTSPTSGVERRASPPAVP